VYYDNQELNLDYVNESGNIVLDYTNDDYLNGFNLTINVEDYDAILAKNPNARIIIEKSNIGIVLPLKGLPAGNFVFTM
ncbi:hypothetical protein, partial [Pseudomonas syringae group genomosp. 7]|uniref:hypothetical protein n=1 Tax=Pseudomonas syringae group genomosp. 7 TaxID=251699 RepID=UPI0037706881